MEWAIFRFISSERGALRYSIVILYAGDDYCRTFEQISDAGTLPICQAIKVPVRVCWPPRASFAVADPVGTSTKPQSLAYKNKNKILIDAFEFEELRSSYRIVAVI